MEQTVTGSSVASSHTFTYLYQSVKPNAATMIGNYRYAYGKEQDAETGLYYYGARYYDPMIAVWYGVDPLAEKAPGWSPYRAFFNNPVRFIDPDGMFENEASAVAYQKEHNIPGNISQGSDGIWTIDDTKGGVSYFQDASFNGIYMAGRGDD